MILMAKVSPIHPTRHISIETVWRLSITLHFRLQLSPDTISIAVQELVSRVRCKALRCSTATVEHLLGDVHSTQLQKHNFDHLVPQFMHMLGVITCCCELPVAAKRTSVPNTGAVAGVDERAVTPLRLRPSPCSASRTGCARPKTS